MALVHEVHIQCCDMVTQHSSRKAIPTYIVAVEILASNFQLKILYYSVLCIPHVFSSSALDIIYGVNVYLFCKNFHSRH